MFIDAWNPRAAAPLCGRQGWRALVFAAAFGAPSLAHADVLQIAADGNVTIFDKPAVFTADDTRPIDVVAPRQPSAHANANVAMRTHFERAGAAAGVSADLIEAVAWAESRFQQSARSRAGAIGVMQLMPETATQMGVDPADAAQNIGGGANYLRAMLDRFNGDVALALAAYNAGPAAVERSHAATAYRETKNYVAAVMDRLADRALEETPQ
jgi:soluble lytic murein transglycosylase-like protein